MSNDASSVEFTHICGICGSEWHFSGNMAQIEMLLELIKSSHSHTTDEAVVLIGAANQWPSGDDESD